MDQLRRDGLLLTPRRRRAARIAGIVGGVGAVLVGTVIFFLGLALIFVPVKERPFVARYVLARYRRRHPLDAGRPQRARAAALMVAIHGDAALLAGDPDLARALGIRDPGPASNRRDGLAPGDEMPQSDGGGDGGGSGGGDGGGGGGGGGD
jgi:hypothetical protein